MTTTPSYVLVPRLAPVEMSHGSAFSGCALPIVLPTGAFRDDATGLPPRGAPV